MMTNKKVQIIRGSKSYAEDILRVAAYCRVSTDSEDQVNSFIAQMHYYYSFIKQAENMELVDVYADEGITGTSVAKRDDFNRMIKDCKAGKIDRIYVKSVSRFAREVLISYMEDYGPIKTVNLNLFKPILDKIFVDESGEIALKFINGAGLKKDMEGACDE